MSQNKVIIDAIEKDKITYNTSSSDINSYQIVGGNVIAAGNPCKVIRKIEEGIEDERR